MRLEEEFITQTYYPPPFLSKQLMTRQINLILFQTQSIVFKILNGLIFRFE